MAVVSAVQCEPRAAGRPEHLREHGHGLWLARQRIREQLACMLGSTACVRLSVPGRVYSLRCAVAFNSFWQNAGKWNDGVCS
jgi:hypothetical protein